MIAPHIASPPGLQATRLWLSANLSAADRAALAGACGDVRTIRAGTDLVRQGTPNEALHILLDGWAARYTIMQDGSRFISALAVPGDICDLDALRFDQLDYGVTMLSAGTFVVLPRTRLDALFSTNPATADAFWSLALAENSVLAAWAASIARRPAQARLAHLFCELLLRLNVTGRVDKHGFDLPLTQEQIADALGLTPVHVNRTLQSLRATGFVSMTQRHVTIHDWAGLCRLCGFRPGYLHLDALDDEAVHEPRANAANRGQIKHSLQPSLSSWASAAQ
jgi:CRP-like cAMP-binding protein